jgi:hypothetical protein
LQSSETVFLSPDLLGNGKNINFDIHTGKLRGTPLEGAAFDNLKGMVAQRYLPHIKAPVLGSSELLRWLHVTKKRRSAYDHYMLQLHDSMKADLAYQSTAQQMNFDFPPGSTWLVYTDQVSHAAMGGSICWSRRFICRWRR